MGRTAMDAVLPVFSINLMEVSICLQCLLFCCNFAAETVKVGCTRHSSSKLSSVLICTTFAVETVKVGCTRHSSSKLSSVLVCTTFAAETSSPDDVENNRVTNPLKTERRYNNEKEHTADADFRALSASHRMQDSTTDKPRI